MTIAPFDDNLNIDNRNIYKFFNNIFYDKIPGEDMKNIICIVFMMVSLSSFNVAQPTQGLIGYWPFKGNAQDMSGNGNHGTVYGASLTTGRDGSPNGAYYFDGASSYISMGSNNFPVTNKVTVSVWFKTSNSSLPLGNLVTKYGWSEKFSGFGIAGTLGPGYAEFYARDQYKYNFIRSYNINYADSNWHFLAGTFDSSVVKIWYDGAKIDSLTIHDSYPDISNSYNLIVGALFNEGIAQGYYFQGSLDDIRIYNRSLSQREINQLYNENNPISNYKLNLSSNPLNGGNTIGAGTYPAGQILTVQAKPNSGFGFLNWTENNSILSTSANYTISLNSNRSLVANFIQQLTVTTLINHSGGGQVTGGGSYNQGTSVTLSAITNVGYSFINWTENGTILSTLSSITFNVTQNRTITANFIRNTFPIVTALSATNITKTSFTANWNAVNGATGYYLDVSIDGLFRNILAPFSKKNIVNNLSYVVNNLAPGIIFYYRVFAYNDTSISLPSNIINVPTIPAPPVLQTPYNQYGTSFTAYWNPVSGAEGYYFDLAIDENMNNILVLYNKKDIGNVSSFQVYGLIPEMNYYYRVKAYNSSGESDYSNIMQVYLITGVEKLNGIPANFELNQNYPNPFNPSTKIQFSLARSTKVKLNVYNLLGKEIVKLIDRELPASTYSVNFNANNLPSGIYFYRITAGDFVKTRKMLLIK